MFIDIKFPEAISHSSIGGVHFSTNIIETTNGFESRKNIGSHFGRCHFDISQSIKTQDEIELLISFFRIVGGMKNSFRFKDPNDFTATKQELLPLDNSMKLFSFVKRYIFENTSVTRNISKITKNSVILDIQETEYNINYTNGTVLFLELQKQNPLASFQFDIEARFNTPALEIALNNFGAKQTQKIEIIEI